MKTKVLATAMLFIALVINSQNGFKNFTKDLIVNTSKSEELTNENGTSLNPNSVYKIHLVTRGTGTKTGSEYLAWTHDNVWIIRVVNVRGTNSNHPLLFVENNTIKVKTNHPNNYTIKALVTELQSQTSHAVGNLFGASHQWQREVNNLFYTDGNVGIGTKSTQNGIFTVNGDSYSTLRLENDTANKESSIRFRSKSALGGVLHSDISLYATGPNQGYLGFKVPHNNTANEGFDMIINHAGQIGIGTTNTGNHKLAVEGSVGAREIKVEATGWSDFVFEKEYKLPTLLEVESHIKEKGHLKDIPSEKDVIKNGFFLGEMDSKLLQKIEELTLYTINQEKQLKTQNSKIEQLKKENNLLKSLLERVIELEKKIE